MYSLGKDKYDCCAPASDDECWEDERPVTVTQTCREGEKDSGNKGQNQATQDQELRTTNRCDATTIDHYRTGNNTKR